MKEVPVMRTKRTKPVVMLAAGVVTVVLSALPAFATGGTDDCSAATCTSPVVGTGHHVDEETR
jgi:hypothetical protein